MPTGYTAPVRDGEVTTLSEFALICARNFGALVMMRDDPLNAEIPERIEPNTRHIEQRIDEARARIAELEAMSNADRITAAQNAHAERIAQNERFNRQAQTYRKRYEAMIAAVETWEPPTPEHENLKTFMLQQLRESIRFDCGTIQIEVKPLDSRAWWGDELERAHRDLRRYSDQRDKEIRLANERNEWIQQLRDSFPQEVVQG